MVTPGIAGGLVMLITNTCASQFDLPAKWAALILSALITFFAVTAASGGILKKVFFWIFNSLIIFSMAMGTNQAGISLAKEPASTYSAPPRPSPTPKPATRPEEKESKPFFHDWVDHGGGRGKM